MQIRVLAEDKGSPTAADASAQGDRSQAGGHGDTASAEKKEGGAVETAGKADAARSGTAAPPASPEGFVVVGHCDAAAGASTKEKEEDGERGGEEAEEGNWLVLAEAAYSSGCVLVELDPTRPTALKLTIGGAGGGGGASGGGDKTILVLGAADA